MRELDLGDIQMCLLDCLIYLDRVCRAHGIRYSLAYGTLLGAVRHHGFIPWDDDVDVLMMRSDYEKFRSAVLADTTQSNFTINDETNNAEWFFTRPCLCHAKTRIIFTGGERNIERMGLFVDIFLLDYAFDDTALREYVYSSLPQQRRYIKKKVLEGLGFYHVMKVINSCINGANDMSWLPRMQRKFGESSREVTVVKIMRSVLKITGYRWLYRLRRLLLFLLPKKSAVLVDLHSVEFYRADIFDDLVELEFAGHKFLATALYHECLAQRYGNYMKIPKKKTKAKHGYAAYALDAVNEVRESGA